MSDATGVPLLEEVDTHDRAELERRLWVAERQLIRLSEELRANQREYETLSDGYRTFLAEADRIRSRLEASA